MLFWITRKHVHVDRVACPWLISRFIDKDAQFLFLPKEEILDFAEKTGAIAYDTPGAEIYHFSRDGIQYCSFDALIEKFSLQSNVALLEMQKIIRAADTGLEKDNPLALAVEAIASGAPLVTTTDHEALAIEFPFYDVLYAYLQGEIVKKRYSTELKTLKGRSEINLFIKEKIQRDFDQN